MTTLADLRVAADTQVYTCTDDTTPAGHFTATTKILGITVTYLLAGALDDPATRSSATTWNGIRVRSDGGRAGAAATRHDRRRESALFRGQRMSRVCGARAVYWSGGVMAKLWATTNEPDCTGPNPWTRRHRSKAETYRTVESDAGKWAMGYDVQLTDVWVDEQDGNGWRRYERINHKPQED